MERLELIFKYLLSDDSMQIMPMLSAEDVTNLGRIDLTIATPLNLIIV